MRTEDIQVKDIMTRGVLTMPVESTAGDIVTVMAENKLSAVAIIDKSGEAVGIISEMDILARIDRIDWKNTLVDELVALSIESINPSSTLQEAAQIMTKKHIHRLVVMSEKCVGASNRPVGIVSAGDLMKKYLQ
ncbi:MAG: CBS domain-containing protein [Methanosarcinaceae archaeon]|nr:CBS domain-containing protein [Methanosarcinaceae archaeon]MDF1533252.1 CBS domain-containing protein [Methanosarcinaceae archaeon]